MNRNLLAGVFAGAAGITVLNAVTYLDTVVRARSASSTPEKTVQRVEQLAGASLSEGGRDSEAADNRRSGLGALMGMPPVWGLERFTGWFDPGSVEFRWYFLGPAPDWPRIWAPRHRWRR